MGHLDPGEAPSDAALRESQEETGLELTHPVGGPRLIHVDVHDAAHGHTHLDLRYLLVAPDRDPAPLPGESPEARWFGWDEADAVADEALVGALRAARLQPEAGAGIGPSPTAPDRAVGRCGRQGCSAPAQWWGEMRRRRPPPRHRRTMTTADGAQEPGNEPETPVRPLARLLEVQDHDTVIDQIRHRRATLPERAELAEVDRQLGVLDVRTKELRSQRDELGDRQGALEQQIEASRTRRESLEKRLFGGQIVASRELQAMNEEVLHLARHISELEDREIEVMEGLEPLDGELASRGRDARRPRQRRRAPPGSHRHDRDVARCRARRREPGAGRRCVGRARRPAGALRAAAIEAGGDRSGAPRGRLV